MGLKNMENLRQEGINKWESLREMHFDSLGSMIEQLVKLGFRKDAFEIVKSPHAKYPRYRTRLRIKGNSYDMLDEPTEEGGLRFNDFARDLIMGNTLPKRINREELLS